MDEGLRDAWLTRLGRWVALHPVAESEGLALLANEIAITLERCGLTVERRSHASGDLLIASRKGQGPMLGVYGHYDVEVGGRRALQIAGGRLFGRGVADNLGPLALRLSVLELMSKDGLNVLWVIEPGEEVGSPALADWCRSAGCPEVSLWLDETGYFEAGGTQRVLVVEPDNHASEIVRRCAALASERGRATRVEPRRLRRVVATAGFSVEALFRGVSYLALGPNDDASEVHGDGESLPLDTFDLSARQFEAVLKSFYAGGLG